MGIITIGTPFNIDLEFKIAVFGKRFLAWFIDFAIICIYYYVMLLFAYPKSGRSENMDTAANIFLIVIPVMFYQLCFEIFFNGQTLGKKVAGIKVIDKEGREPTVSQYVLRWILSLGNLLMYIVPYILLWIPAFLFVFIIFYLPDFLCILISPKSQRIGDLAAGTVVIDKNYKPDITETIHLEIEQKDYKPLFPQVMRLSDKDINGIRNLLAKKGTKDTDHYVIDVTQKIKTVLDIQSDMLSTDFLQQLLKDYNYFTTKN